MAAAPYNKTTRGLIAKHEKAIWITKFKCMAYLLIPVAMVTSQIFMKLIQIKIDLLPRKSKGIVCMKTS